MEIYRLGLSAIALPLLLSSATVWAGEKPNKLNSPIPLGKYECQISQEYKFRPCEVVLNSKKQPTLKIPKGGLLSLEGTIQKQGNWILVESQLTEARPFGCFYCQQRCSLDPGSCDCQELLPFVAAKCKQQPLHLLLKPSTKGKWTGVLPYLVYQNKYENGKVVGYDTRAELFNVTIRQP